jgi:hypothetical protein
MRQLKLTALALGILAWGPALAAMAQTRTAPAAPDATIAKEPVTQAVGDGLPTDALCPCRLLTIAKGDRSGWGHNVPGFMGADLIIRDPDAWKAFWSIHTAGIIPPPPPPPIDFLRQVVIATIQGIQTSGGGPNTAIVGLEQRGPFVAIGIFDDERPGPLDVLTNPFHIVAVERRCLPPQSSVVFEHAAPLPGTSVVEGHVFAGRPEAPPAPLPGAIVTLAGPNTDPAPARASTGVDGTYFFVNVPRGAYLLHAEARGFEPAEAPLQVPADARVGHDFLLRPLPPPARVTGQVMHPIPGGVGPLPGTLMQLMYEGAVAAQTGTDERGMYLFPEVRPGKYVLRASHVGFAPQAVEIAVEPGQTVVRNFLLQPEQQPRGALVGKVLGAPNANERIPLADAAVMVLSSTGIVATAMTDLRGDFGIPDLPPGQYIAIAAKPGWKPQQAPVEILAGQATEHVFTLEPMLRDEPAP